MTARDTSHAVLSSAFEFGHEERAGSGDHAVLKLWLRMLATTAQIERDIRTRLRERFGITLARFDCLAQMHRYREGLSMRVLAHYLMVTGGNVTALTDELERRGTVVRRSSPDNRRSSIVSLTPHGRRACKTMAGEHEHWILGMFSALDSATVQQLHAHLGALRVHMLREEP